MTALDHLEHAMPGVLDAPEACRVLHGGWGEVSVSRLELGVDREGVL